LGRVEAGLEVDLMDRRDITRGERSALRVQARALDVAEAAQDPDLISRANLAYLELRRAAGLTAGGVKPVDAFDNLLVELSRAGTGSSDLPQS
jgi:hypothetical protein